MFWSNAPEHAPGIVVRAHHRRPLRIRGRRLADRAVRYRAGCRKAVAGWTSRATLRETTTAERRSRRHAAASGGRSPRAVVRGAWAAHRQIGDVERALSRRVGKLCRIWLRGGRLRAQNRRVRLFVRPASGVVARPASARPAVFLPAALSPPGSGRLRDGRGARFPHATGAGQHVHVRNSGRLSPRTSPAVRPCALRPDAARGGGRPGRCRSIN